MKGSLLSAALGPSQWSGRFWLEKNKKCLFKSRLYNACLTKVHGAKVKKSNAVCRLYQKNREPHSLGPSFEILKLCRLPDSIQWGLCMNGFHSVCTLPIQIHLHHYGHLGYFTALRLQDLMVEICIALIECPQKWVPNVYLILLWHRMTETRFQSRTTLSKLKKIRGRQYKVETTGDTKLWENLCTTNMRGGIMPLRLSLSQVAPNQLIPL